LDEIADRRQAKMTAPINDPSMAGTLKLPLVDPC
jgi:hypothetical protein